jgi:hypothetical protein
MTRFALSALAVGLLAGCAAPQTVVAPVAPVAAPALPSAPGITLANSDFEADFPAGGRCPMRWECKSHADPNSHRFRLDETAPASGRRSLCIERVTREPWALATQVVRDASLRGARVRFSIAVRVDGAVEGAGPWVLAHRRSGQNVHEQSLAKSTTGWQRLSVEVALPADTDFVEVGATLEGAGRVCLDDARLEVLQGSKSPV